MQACINRLAALYFSICGDRERSVIRAARGKGPITPLVILTPAVLTSRAAKTLENCKASGAAALKTCRAQAAEELAKHQAKSAKIQAWKHVPFLSLISYCNFLCLTMSIIENGIPIIPWELICPNPRFLAIGEPGNPIRCGGIAQCLHIFVPAVLQGRSEEKLTALERQLQKVKDAEEHLRYACFLCLSQVLLLSNLLFRHCFFELAVWGVSTE